MRITGLVLAMVVTCGLAASCSSGHPATVAPVVAAAAHVILRVGATATQGAVVIDDRGRTLYVSNKETIAQAACTKQCLQVWPVVLLTASGTATTDAKGIDASEITTVPVADGRAVAYHGHVLHTYVGDPTPGDAAGQGIGGEWSTITPAGVPSK